MTKRILSILLLTSAWSLAFATPVQFEDQSDKLGFTRGTETWGIAWGNLNGDKWPDIWNSGHRDFPRMYRNTGDGDFDDVTMLYDRNMNGYWIGNTQLDVHAGTWGDYDNDGDDDIIVGDEDEFFINNANAGGFFSKRSLTSNSRHASWNNTDSDRFLESDISCNEHYILLFDVDVDGDMDEICAGEGVFPKSVSGASSRLIPTIGLSNDAALGDFNNDLRTDIIVTRGSLRPTGASKVNNNRIEAWFRGGTGASFTFSAQGEVTFLVDGHSGGAFLVEQVFVLNTNGPISANSDRGVSISYSSQTGLWTVSDTGSRQAYVRAIAKNTVSDPVMRGLVAADEPQATYHGVNTASGIDWVFGTGLGSLKSCVSVVAADFDNDMDLDLYLACRNGVDNLANKYLDNQGDGTFREVQSHGGEGPVGSGVQFGTSDSVISADYDVDGFMDLAVSNGLLFFPVSFGGPDSLIRNKGNGNHWIEMDLIGTTSPRAAIGAKVFVTAGGITQLREQAAGYHRWSQNHSRIHVGLAGNTTIDRIRIEWPSGKVDIFNNVAADALYNVTESGGIAPVGAETPVHVTFLPGDECGEPVYTTTLGPAMLIWRQCGTDNWLMRAKGGLGRLTEGRNQIAAGQILSDFKFGYANPVAADSNDMVDNSTNKIINFSLSVQQDTANSKGINFATTGQSRTCFTLDGNDFEAVYLGNTGRRIDLPFDLTTLGPCVVDFDGDGLDDDIDPDDDNDGVLDGDDAFPYDPDESVDSDNDGVGDNADVFPNDPAETKDSDNDGVGNNADAFPNNPNETTDSDGDGVGDNADQFPNDPNESTDTDGDGIGDNGDVDTDNDGIINEAEGVVKKYRYIRLMKSGSNPGGNVMNLAEIEVIDNLGVNRARNASASSSSNYGTRFYAPACVDGRRAGDSLSNQGMCSTGQSSANEWWQVDLGASYEIDKIRIFNRDDCCQDRLSNVYVLASQTPFANNTNLSAARSNADFEFQIGNVSASNPDRIINNVVTSTGDFDGDGINNEFDLDSDNDGIADVVEAGLTDADGNYLVDDLINDQGSVSNPPDSDGDGIPDFLDLESQNAANNGTAYDINTTVNAALDSNNDGQVNSADANGGTDQNNNGVNDVFEDADQDGISNLNDPDDDNDGVLDGDDAFPLDATETTDTDGDGVGDNGDVFPNNPNETADSDGDGVGDNSDAFPLNPNESADSDGDGVGNNADAFPNNPNETKDTDGDGVGDNSDVDKDNDGITNEAESVAKYRYIRLMKSGSNPGGNVMNLAEVEVIDNLGVNRARNASASLSSNYGTRFYAPACVDGRRSGDHLSNQGMCSTGQSSANEWWQVDLGASYEIDKIRIFNRDDCCQDRLSNVYVLASQTPFANNTNLSAARSNADFEFQIGNVSASNPDRIINNVVTNTDDFDGDGINNEFDLDSDNDGIADVVEAGLTDADGNYLVDDLINDQGSVSNPPDSDGDGIPDFLDLESQNAANNGTAYDINTTVHAAQDTNNDGMIGSADSGGGVDADSDGIDDLIDTNPNQPGGGSGPTDSDGDGVPDTQDAYPNDATRTVPAVSVTGAVVMEGSGNAVVNIDLSTRPRKPASIVVSTTSGSASSGSDYGQLNETLTFAIGQTHQSILIPVIDDTVPEGSESFSVNLSGASGLTLSNSSATVTIQDNDSGGISDACFEPVYDSTTEKGVFLWKLCDGSGEWKMRVTGGGDSNGVFYNGYLESMGGLTYTEFSIEAHDAIDNSNPDILTYVMKTWNGAEDGLNFVPATDACLTTTAPDVPLYLGQNRIEVDSPFNLTTLAACAVVSPAAECGEPTYDSATEQGIFLWKDCITGQWEVRLSAGGDAGGAIINGSVTSTAGFTQLTEFSLESSDTVDNATNINEIMYELKVWNAAQDGFGFTPSSADACFIQESGLPVYLGEGKQQITSPLNLDTLANCNIAEPAECGEPGYDRTTEPGLYLWKDCSAAGPAAQWRVRVAGGGLSWSPYNGYLLSNNPVIATGVQLEASDTIDATLGDNGLDYILNVANAALDGLDILIPANSTTCFELQVMPTGSQLYVGREKLTEEWCL